MVLQTGKVIENFRRGPVLRIDELTPNLAATIDNVCVRKNKGSINRVGVPLRIADGQVIDFVPGKKLPVGAFIFVYIHAQHDQLGHLALELVERGNLFDTRGTPAGPEVEKNHLAVVGAQLEAASAVGDRKVRGWPSDLPRMVTPVATRGEQEREQEHTSADPRTHVSIIMPSGLQQSAGSLQLGVFRLGLLEDRDVGVGVFPQRQEILIRGPSLHRVALHSIGSADLEMRERSDGFV